MQKLPRIPLHGWLAIDKPVGMTSADVVNKVKWLTRVQKLGHAGTLDPLASGVLPIAFGEATKTIAYCMDSTKTYVFTVSFGAATATDDREGKIIATSDVLPTCEEIEAALPAFTGKILQTPPVYSAIKVGGERAYKLAREGEKVELKAREVEVFSLSRVRERVGVRALASDSVAALTLPSPARGRGLAEATFEMTCGKGTYVRALARDLALKLGTFGHITALRRTRVGHFTEKNTILLENLEKIVHSAPPSESVPEVLLPVEAVLDDIPVLHLDDNSARLLAYGQTVKFAGASLHQGIVCAFAQGRLLALAQAADGAIKPVRIFNLSS